MARHRVVSSSWISRVFLALCVALVAGCDRIVRSDDDPTTAANTLEVTE